MNRLGNVDELNSTAVFLASNASTFMTGSDIIIDVSVYGFLVSQNLLILGLGWLLLLVIVDSGPCLIS
jgi:hypothetical protein